MRILNKSNDKRVIVTALYGNYENFNNFDVINSTNIPMLCFTDNPDLKSNQWKFIVTNDFINFGPRLKTKIIKLIGNGIINNFEEVMWMDNTIKLKIDPVYFFDDWLANFDLALIRHSFRDKVLDEFVEVFRLQLDDNVRLSSQLINYSINNPEILEEKVYWSGLFLKRNSTNVKSFSLEWLLHNFEFSKRDQLSINVALRSYKLNVNEIVIDNFDNDFLSWPHSRQRKIVDHESLYKYVIPPSILSSNLPEGQTQRIPDLIENSVKTTIYKSWRLSSHLTKIKKMIKASFEK